MSMMDPIADMLTRIRNAQMSRLINVTFAYSEMKRAILDVLVDEGYVCSYRKVNISNKDCLEIVLKYSKHGVPVINEIHKVSKPSKRIYFSIKKLRHYYNNMGIYILSTSKGIMSDRSARHLNVGGEIVCKVF